MQFTRAVSARRDRWVVPSFLIAAWLLGACLRLDQFSSQVLLDDEWHQVHTVMSKSPAEMLVDFGYADYGIPLGILAWAEANAWGLSETGLRIPMLVAGLLFIALAPAYVLPRMGARVAIIFSFFLALSPLLVIFSRMARPYAISLLLAWIAHCAYRKFECAKASVTGSGSAYVGSATMAMWFHPVVAPFVLAPPLWSMLRSGVARKPGWWLDLRKPVAISLVLLGTAAILLLPPLLSHPESLALKSGLDQISVDSLAGALFLWFGTSSPVLLVLCAAFGAFGLPRAWRKLEVFRTALFGCLLTLLVIMFTKPQWVQYPAPLARYLLPAVPIVLLSIAAGIARFSDVVTAMKWAPTRLVPALLTGAMLVALVATSPLPAMLRYPNTQTLHGIYNVDFRTDRNLYARRLADFPASQFWTRQAERAPGSVKMAVAPFYFESYNWNAPTWEKQSRQTVVPGYLTGLCAARRWGEPAQSAKFRFANGVHLADRQALATMGIDYVVWQKPLPLAMERSAINGDDTQACLPRLRAEFGPAVFEDDTLVAFSARAVPRAR